MQQFSFIEITKSYYIDLSNPIESLRNNEFLFLIRFYKCKEKKWGKVRHVFVIVILLGDFIKENNSNHTFFVLYLNFRKRLTIRRKIITTSYNVFFSITKFPVLPHRWGKK